MSESVSINQYLNALGLVKSIREAVSHLEQRPDNSQLRQDTLYAIGTVSNLFPENAELRRTKKEFAVALSGGVEFTNSYAAWDIQAMIAIGSTLLPFLTEVRDISIDDAELLFQMANDPRWSPETKSQILYRVSAACGLAAPEQAYHGMLEAFRLNPDVVRIEGRDNSPLAHIPEQKTFTHCPICRSTGKPYFASQSYLMNNYELPFEPAKLWMKCPSCGNLYTWHFPRSFLENGQTVKKIQPRQSVECTGISSGSALHIWSKILNHLAALTSGRSILEIGIGRGEFIAVALEMGYDIESVEILESEAQRVADILGADIWCCDFLKFETSKRYAIITMGDVIEHVTDPEAALRKAYMLLEDDGVLWLSTPNFDSSFSRLLKFKDAMWKEPTHITYFNFTGLQNLAEKCGFEVAEYEVSARYNGSMELVLRKIN